MILRKRGSGRLVRMRLGWKLRDNAQHERRGGRRGGVLKPWAARHAMIALSSREAEFDAIGRAMVGLIAVRPILSEFGWSVRPRLCLVHASVAQGVESRRGLGQVRHLDVRFLLLQQSVRSGALLLHKVSGHTGPADAVAKPMRYTDSMRSSGNVAVR